jgi:anti-sigma regulatory factor (Ser/Thr protein kinase)
VDESGRGLIIVRALVDDLSVHHTGAETVVTCLMRTAQTSSRSADPTSSSL